MTLVVVLQGFSTASLPSPRAGPVPRTCEHGPLAQVPGPAGRAAVPTRVPGMAEGRGRLLHRGGSHSQPGQYEAAPLSESVVSALVCLVIALLLYQWLAPSCKF
jgi:hypothetical protein